MLEMSKLALARAQQRGIPVPVIENLLSFGREAYDHRGACLIYFDRRAKVRLRSAIGKRDYKWMELHLDAYAVVASDGEVITVGHRTKHVTRH